MNSKVNFYIVIKLLQSLAEIATTCKLACDNKSQITTEVFSVIIMRFVGLIEI